MKKWLIKVMLLAMFLALAAFAWGQSAFYEEPFDTDNGWTLESNWSITSGALKLSWTPSVTNYDLSATSPNIVVPASAGDMVVSHYIDQYTYDEGNPPETFEIIVVANGTDNILWTYNTNANWGVYGGQDLSLPLASYAGQTIQLKFRSTGESTFNFNGWYIYDITAYASLNNDLAATSISGNTTPSANSAYPYVIAVRNGGMSTINNYTVKLMQTGNVELGSANGGPIAPGATVEHTISWTPTTLGATQLWGKVISAGDENPNNNETALLNVTVMTESLQIVDIGTGTATQRFPLGSYFGYERSAALYTAAELGAQNSRIFAISWYSSIATTAAVPTKIYLKTIGASTLTTDTWDNMIAGAVLLYDQTQTGLAAGDWNLYALNSSFDVGQGDNLLILVERNFGGNGAGTPGGSSAGGGIYSSPVPGSHLTWNADNNAPTGTGSTAANRPNVRLAYSTYAIDTPPNPAIVGSPADAAIDVTIDATLNWNSGGGGPTGYKLYFGTNNPPTNIVNNSDLGDVFTYEPNSLAYATNYYWQIVPYNAIGDAIGCPVWSFSTMADPTIASFPHTQNFDAVTVPALPFGWSSINVDSDTAQWASYASNPYSAPNCVSIGYNYSLALNDWMVSPPISLQAGTTYALDFKYRGGSTSYVEKLKVMLGNGNQVADLSTQIFIDDNINFSDYTTALATFTVPSSGTYYLGWHAYSIANQLRLYVDDIRIRIPAPIPPQPATVVFPLNGSTTLLNPMLKWSPSLTGEPATGYKLYLNTTGVFSEADLKYTGTAPQFQTSDLANGITYRWKVVPTNAFGEASACPTWSFNTPMTDQLAEGFEATGFPPPGWANGSSGSWTRNTSTPRFEGSASAYKYTSTSLVYVLSTPMLTLTGSSTMDFYTRASSTSQVLQIVSSEDRVTWAPIAGIADITYDATGIWYPISIDLSSLAGTNRYIGFQTPTQTSTGSIYVDHVVGPFITPVAPGIPTLTAPADAAVNQSIAPNLTWTPPTTGGVVTGYNVYIDTEDGSTLYASNVTSPYSPVPPLAYERTYYWTVRAYNGAGTGDPAAPRSFTTMVDPTIYDLPWLEDFGTVTGDWPVPNWNQLSGLYPTPTGTSIQWYRDEWLNGPSGNNAARINIYGTLRYGWLVTPPIAIPADGHELKFDLGLTRYNSTDPILDNTDQQDDKFIVAMSDSPNMANPTILREWNNSGSAYVYNDILHTVELVSIPRTGISGNMYFAFYGESTASGGDNDLMVDNVMVRAIPTGPPDPVTLASPEDGATELPIDGFNLTWAAALTGGNPVDYAVFMSQNEANLYGDHYWDGITDTRFDPTQAA
ncbi:MAG: choice-of-anchor J domain-containing protein, partial [Candidatus Cloacimonetes bacterium]|nr:choice-of-anchor J domain-containing protein [Candidatus Cloacimonadota bacterium]MCK9243380.1 choice-of-anchor J domain-containing protein [Candidatus Cloacimonadota bacterium]